MKGDFSRLRFDATKHYAAVLEQQGRVALDADGNEATAINDYLRTTTNRDVIGRCGVPKHGGGFEIGPIPASGTGVTDLSISAGRMYVDGILCEQDSDTTYLGQVDYPNAPFAPVAGQTDLVYLDVWQQHVTAIEDDALRERALGGPDTTTRLRTVCQVKILPNVGAGGPVSCSSDIPAWDALRAPTTARLTTQVAAGPADEPCTLAPGGGYAGLENQLYRVEIHASQNGTAGSFKWSRDNGSIVVAVTDFLAGNQVEVERLGWDDVRALRKNDWVEVLNDATELQGVPGTIARIVDILPGRILQLDRNVSAHDDDARHPRVRRWDQGGEAIAIPSGPVTIENRIELTFSGSDFRSGDYWAFAARVGYGDRAGDIIDTLADAAPRGIVHHYCKLALVTWSAGAGGTVNAAETTDCRVEFPPLTELPKAATCCTVTVGDGVRSVGDFTDLQEAIDEVPDGGTVCVLPGEYVLRQPVRIDGRNGVTISGCGRAARILAGQFSALIASRSEAIRLQGLSVEAASPRGAMAFDVCREITIVGCHVQQAATRAPAAAVPAIVVAAGESIRIQTNTLLGNPGVAVSGEDITIADNRLLGGGVWIQEGTAFAHVAGNRIAGGGAGAGITLGGELETEVQPGLTGVSAVRIERNVIQNMGESGITTMASRAGTTTPPTTVAPPVGPALSDTRAGAALLSTGIVAADSVRAFTAFGSTTTYVAPTGRGQADDLAIVNNQIQGCVTRPASGGQVVSPRGAIVLHGVSRVRIAGNDISDNGTVGTPCCGVLVHTCRELEIANNRIVANGSTGWDGSGAPQAGILAYQVTEGSTAAARIHDNTVVCPRGHSLLVVALGQVSIVGNTLASLDVVPRPSRQDVLGGTAATGAGVVVWNGGVKSGLPDFQSFWRNVMGITNVRAVAAAPAARVLPDGRIVFQGNQVTVSSATGASEQSPLRTAVNVLSFDDVGLDANEIDVKVAGMSGVMAMARTLRVSDNRIADDPERMSYLGVAKWHIVAGNQATKCLVALGEQVIDAPNQVTFADPIYALAFCERAKKAFEDYLRRQGFAIR